MKKLFYLSIFLFLTAQSCEEQDFCIGYKYIVHKDWYQEVSVPCEWYNEPIRDMGFDSKKHLILFFLENDTVWSVDEDEWWLNPINTFNLLSINTYNSIKPYKRSWRN